MSEWFPVALYLTLLAIAVPLASAMIWLTALFTFLDYRRTRLVLCPETGRAAAVGVDVKRAVRMRLIRHLDLRLDSCSRWPSRCDCPQDCLAQIQAEPKDCLARTTPAGELASPQGLRFRW